MIADGIDEQWEWNGARHDLWNTMVAPTFLLSTARFMLGLSDRNEPIPEGRQAE